MAKTALVIGGIHGLGMAMAKVLGHAEAKIVVNDLSQVVIYKTLYFFK